MFSFKTMTLRKKPIPFTALSERVGTLIFLMIVINDDINHVSNNALTTELMN